MKLDERTGCGVDEAPGMVGLFQLGEASLLQRRNRLGPLVKYQQVDVRHGPMGHRAVEALRNRRTLERQATHPARAEEFLNPARRIELAESNGECLLVGAAESSSVSIWPAQSPLSERLMEKA